VDGATQEHDAVFEQAAEDVPGSFATVRGLHDARVDQACGRSALEDGERLSSGFGSFGHFPSDGQSCCWILAFDWMMSSTLFSRIIPISISRFLASRYSARTLAMFLPVCSASSAIPSSSSLSPILRRGWR